MAQNTTSGTYFLRVGGLITISTLFLTAAFVGILGFVSGEIEGIQSRLPWYIVVGALGFVGTIILLEAQDSHGRIIMVTSIVVSSAVFVIVSLGIEGMLFALAHPEMVFVSQLVLYFLAAALIGTGLGYWGLNHWREFTGQSDARL